MASAGRRQIIGGGGAPINKNGGGAARPTNALILLSNWHSRRMNYKTIDQCLVLDTDVLSKPHRRPLGIILNDSWYEPGMSLSSWNSVHALLSVE